jgi:hypothetical protein
MLAAQVGGYVTWRASGQRRVTTISFQDLGGMTISTI